MNKFELDKESFRKSKAWEKFRKFKYAESSMDYVTRKRLRNNYNLHHIDLNPNNYKDLSDPDKFVNLNSDIHSIVHKLYPYYKKDSGVIDRLKEVLDKMVECNKSEHF